MPIAGFYNFKFTIRKRSLGPTWLHVQRGIQQDISPADEEDVAELKDILNKSWLDLDRMRFCTKLSMCVIRYKKTFQMGNVTVRANLVQSIAIIINRISNITNKLNMFGNNNNYKQPGTSYLSFINL